MKCQAKNCNLKPFWAEILPSGETVICFKVRHHGSYHVQKYTFEEIEKVFGGRHKSSVGINPSLAG